MQPVIGYREIRPSAALAPFVDAIWTLDHDGVDPSAQRVVPDGHPELILNLGQPFEFFDGVRWHGQPRCFLAGQIEGPLLLRPSGAAKMVGIRFHPHGAGSVLHAPVESLAGRFTPIADLAPQLARDLDRALTSVDPVAGVDCALVGRLGYSSARDLVAAEAVRRIIGERGACDLTGLASDLGVSIRQLERRFHASVGLPPKLFCRMQRFIHVFRAVSEQPSNWADAAVDCGYYDQAHLIRDFRSFSGATPAALLADDADLARHFLERFGLERLGLSRFGMSPVRVSHSYNTARF